MCPYYSPLLVVPHPDREAYIEVTPETARWDVLNFAARKLHYGQQWQWETGECELALVILGGVCNISSNQASWQNVGRRKNVFDGMPYTLYLPRHTSFTIEAGSPNLDIAYGWCMAHNDHPARLVTPSEVEIEIRGGGNATRQINKMIPPGFDCSRLVVVEVFTPAGNWSSYPPHKHDQHRVDDRGRIIEADLEEIYFYKFEHPEAFAYQRIYTSDGKWDELILARDSHLVLSPEGYHPVVAAHGYNCYYLNFLAGSAQSLAASDDPDYIWVKGTWKDTDPRLPLVCLDMEP